jgi:hypothetical protein
MIAYDLFSIAQFYRGATRHTLRLGEELFVGHPLNEFAQNLLSQFGRLCLLLLGNRNKIAP